MQDFAKEGRFQNTKGVLIDFDGTLVDSMPFLYAVYVSFLARFGIKGSEQEFRSLIGATLSEVVLALNTRYQLSSSMDSLMLAYHRLLQECYAKISLMPGAFEFLVFAKSKRLSLAVVSAAKRQLVESVLATKGVLDLFDVTVCGEDVNKGKPDPAIYQQGLKRLSLNAQEAIAIEDSLHGIQASLQAEITSILLVQDLKAQDIPQAYKSRLILATNWFDIQRLF